VPTQQSHQPSAALEKLEHGIQYKLVLIVAPPGTGKTNLIQQWTQNWLNSSAVPPIWLSIDIEDNQPNHFLLKLISEIEHRDPNIEDRIDIQLIHDQRQLDGRSSEPELLKGFLPPTERILTEIINELFHQDGDRFLILLDYHHIFNPDINTMIEFLIDYLPPNFHLLITSEIKPHLQIAHLRARRELLEIGPEDLR
jgi:LuxR family maltose regulon positive regulatory protein